MRRPAPHAPTHPLAGKVPRISVPDERAGRQVEERRRLGRPFAAAGEADDLRPLWRHARVAQPRRLHARETLRRLEEPVVAAGVLLGMRFRQPAEQRQRCCPCPATDLADAQRLARTVGLAVPAEHRAADCLRVVGPEDLDRGQPRLALGVHRGQCLSILTLTAQAAKVERRVQGRDDFLVKVSCSAVTDQRALEVSSEEAS